MYKAIWQQLKFPVKLNELLLNCNPDTYFVLGPSRLFRVTLLPETSFSELTPRRNLGQRMDRQTDRQKYIMRAIQWRVSINNIYVFKTKQSMYSYSSSFPDYNASSLKKYPGYVCNFQTFSSQPGHCSLRGKETGQL